MPSHNGIEQILQYKKSLIHVIKKYLPESDVFLFGSRAMESNRPASDIDLAVKTEGLIDHRILNQINEEVDALNIPFFVDVVDYHAVYEDMRNFIDKTGIRWNL